MNRFTLNAFCLSFQPIPVKEVQAVWSETTFFQGSLWEKSLEKVRMVSDYSCHPNAFPLALQMSPTTHTSLVQYGIGEMKTIFLARELRLPIKHPKAENTVSIFSLAIILCSSSHLDTSFASLQFFTSPFRLL